MSEYTEESGMDIVLNSIGEAYYYGFGIETDYAEAVRFFTKAASMGNGYAMYRLGQCLENGDGIPQNIQSAFDCYSDSVRAGCPAAMIRIGDLYWTGYADLVEQNRSAAAQWYQQALNFAEAEPESLDFISAAVRVADCMKDGIGMERNAEAACSLYRLAENSLHHHMSYSRDFDEALLEQAEKGILECGGAPCQDDEAFPAYSFS